MKKFLYCCAFMAFFLYAGNCFSQNKFVEINQQVWKIQLQAMNQGDSEQFISVLSKDVVQVSYDRRIIRDHASFARQVRETYKRMKERKLERQMEFRFLERIAGEELAFETGYFKYELTNEKAEKSVYFGYFQVVLRKEAGVWKVLVDYDGESYGGNKITAEQFSAAKPMDAY